VDETFYRPAEVQILMGDYSKAKKILGWKPTVSFKGLIEMMVDSDLKYMKK
jgi:GDPmannose 4,6-dehydratase